MPAQLNLGFIGGALNSAVGYAHFTASRMDGRFRLAAGCFSRDPKTNAQSADRYGVSPEHVHADWGTLLDAECGNLDAIAILTPTPTHFPILEKAMASGIPVICEKALVATLAEGQEIERIAQATRSHVTVTYNYTGYPMVRELRRMIREGALGRLLHIQVEMPQEGFARVTGNGAPQSPQAWRLTDGPIPTVSLDLGVHAHHLVEFLTGQTALEVACDQRGCGHFPNIVDDVSCIAQYTDGLRANYWYGKTALGYRNGLSIRVFGDKASAQWIQALPETLEVAQADGERRTLDRASPGVQIACLDRYSRFKAGHPAGFLEAFANLYTDIADALLARREEKQACRDDEYVFGPDSAVRGLAFLDAAAQAARGRRWQPVARPATFICPDFDCAKSMEMTA